MEVKVRRARVDDLKAIVELSHDLFQEDGGTRDPFSNVGWAHAEGFDHFSQHLASSDSVIFVVETEGVLIGYLAGYVRNGSSVRPVKIAELESVFVREPSRSKHVGSQLAKAFFDWSREQEAERVSVTVHASNEGAIRFYQRLGFVPFNLQLERPV